MNETMRKKQIKIFLKEFERLEGIIKCGINELENILKVNNRTTDDYGNEYVTLDVNHIQHIIEELKEYNFGMEGEN